MSTQGKVTNVNNAGGTARAKGQDKGKPLEGGHKSPIIPAKPPHNGQSDGRRAAKPGPGTVTAEKVSARGRTRGSGGASPRSPEDLTITPTPEAGIDLSGRAERINQSHRNGLKAIRTRLEHARDAGAELLAAKEDAGHGKFVKWVEKHCEFSYETAVAYMRISKNWDKLAKRVDPNLQSIADLTLSEALGLLAKPKDKAAAQDGAKHRDVGNAPKGPEKKSDGGPQGSDGADPESAEPDEDAIRVEPSGPSGGSPSRRGVEQADRHTKPGQPPPASPPAGSDPEEQGAGAGLREDRGERNAEDEEPGSVPSDERSLAALPLRAALAARNNTATFDTQASIYLRVRPAIDQLSRLYQPTEHDIRAIDHTDSFGNLCSCWIALLLRVKPPEEWALCKRCQGAGKSGSTGETCGSCEGAGYRMPSVFTEPVDG